MTSAVLERVDHRAAAVGKVAAALASVSAGLHLSMVPDLIRAPSGVVMLLLAALCAGCAKALWFRPTTRAWVMMAAISCVMIVVHGTFMGAAHSDATIDSGHAMAGSGMASGAMDGGHNSTWMTAALAIAIAEAILAIGMSLRLSRVRR